MTTQHEKDKTTFEAWRILPHKNGYSVEDAFLAGLSLAREHHAQALKDENAKLRNRIKKLIHVLEDIENPIAALSRDLPKGCSLNGWMAVQIANDAQTYKRMAREAIDAAMQADKENI